MFALVTDVSPVNLGKVKSQGARKYWEGFVNQKFKHWLHYLKVELDTPDLWEAVAQEKRLPEAALNPHLQNAPFSPQEQQALAGRR